MSRRDKQTNKAETPYQPKGHPTRAQRKSIIAVAMGLEAEQGTPVAMETTTPSPQFNASAQTSVFSAFGEDVGRTDGEAFEQGRQGSAAYTEMPPVNDMTKQCSMVHRMAEMDKRDVDPRDLHKLLPSAMLTSESLDLRADGKIVRGMSGMDVHKLMEDQAMKFNAERGKMSGEVELPVGDGCRLSPTAEEQDLSSPPERRARSFSNQGLMSVEAPVPNSPVTGWPVVPALGIMHPMNHTLGNVAKPCPASAAELVTPNALMYSDSNTTMARLNGTPSGMLLDWSAYHPNGGPQIFQRASYPTSNSTPVILEHPSQEEQYRMGYRPPTTQAPADKASRDTASSQTSESSSSDKEEDAASKKFKSLEAALAWCHVQHSQKQVPVVPKDDVRKLVDFQLNSGKPIRAPWYRPQGDKPEDGKPVEKPVPKKPVTMAPRVKRMTNKVNKQGTGFFCPPGSSMAHV